MGLHLVVLLMDQGLHVSRSPSGAATACRDLAARRVTSHRHTPIDGIPRSASVSPMSLAKCHGPCRIYERRERTDLGKQLGDLLLVREADGCEAQPHEACGVRPSTFA